MANEIEQLSAGAVDTRAALVVAALKLFGEKGYAATSTREVASIAKANIGSIAYYFGGKAGLHRACGEAIVMQMEHVFAPLAATIAAQATMPPEMAKSITVEIFRRMGSFILQSPEAQNIVPFMLREMAHPGEAFGTVYKNMIEPMHRQLCVLVGAATATEPEKPATKLLVFSMIGQLIYFRIASFVVAKRLGKNQYEHTDIEQILAVIETNITAQLNAGKATSL